MERDAMSYDAVGPLLLHEKSQLEAGMETLRYKLGEAFSDVGALARRIEELAAEPGPSLHDWRETICEIESLREDLGAAQRRLQEIGQEIWRQRALMVGL